MIQSDDAIFNLRRPQTVHNAPAPITNIKINIEMKDLDSIEKSPAYENILSHIASLDLMAL